MTAEHGTYARYSAHPGCRCCDCKAAKATYIRERRAAARALAAEFTTPLSGHRLDRPPNFYRYYVPGVKHATSYAYYERGCRCLDCTSWESATGAARQRRKRARRTTASP